MFEKEAKAYATQFNFDERIIAIRGYVAGAEFGYNNGFRDGFVCSKDNDNKLCKSTALTARGFRRNSPKTL